MSEYLLATDSSADLTASMVKEMELEVLPLSFTIKGKTHLNWPDNRDMSPKAFYKALREGEMATTAAVNVADVTARLKELARPGDLILTVGAGDIYQVGEALAGMTEETQTLPS